MELSAETLGWIGLIAFAVLLFTGVPIAYILTFIGFVGYVFASGLLPALKISGLTFFSSIASYSFSVVPLFLLMGYFAYHAGIVSDIYTAAKKWIGHVPGGLAISTIIGGAGFGAVSGSGIASTTTLARVTIPEMIKGGVEKKLAYGVVASAGPLAQMIPPSTLLVMYAIIAEQPVGKLLIAGILPGLLTAALYCLMVYIRVKINPSLAKPVEKAPLKERLGSLTRIWAFLLIAFIVIFGIYTGIFTPNEAGAIGAFGAFCLAWLMKRLNKHVLVDSLLETVRTTSMVFFILGASFIFSYFLSVSRIPFVMSEFLTELPVPPIVLICGIVLMYLILGMFVDMLAAMFITLPILLPAIDALGFDLIWFGVLIVFLAEVALVTPPLGLSLFIIKGVVPDSELKDIVLGSISFIAVDLIVIALLICFPQIATFLPNMMR